MGNLLKLKEPSYLPTQVKLLDATVVRSGHPQKNDPGML